MVDWNMEHEPTLKNFIAMLTHSRTVFGVSPANPRGSRPPFGITGAGFCTGQDALSIARPTVSLTGTHSTKHPPDLIFS